MYRIVKDNVERVIQDETIKNKLETNGWKEISQTIDIKGMKLDELKALADEKGISYDPKIKKEELFQLIEGAD